MFRNNKKRKFKKLLVLLKLSILTKHLTRKYKKKRFWVRNIYKDRKAYGSYYTLIPELRKKNLNEHTHEKFFSYFRMYPENFDELLTIISPFLRTTVSTRSICKGEKLALTLR